MNTPSTAACLPDAAETNKDDYYYANPHIPSFLALPTTDLDHPIDANNVVQVLPQGSNLTADNFRNGHLDIHRPVLVTDTAASSIGMKVPPQDFSVRNVAEKVGQAYPVHVLDVQLQTEMEGWTMGDLVEYFEDPKRLEWNRRPQQQQGMSNDDTTLEASKPSSSESATTTTLRRPRRAAALQSHVRTTTRPPVLNQLSLELSRTSMGPPYCLSPQFVRDMDWIDLCWPAAWRRKSKYPMVQYYCLTSAAGAWTDFHVDFGGTSVWYHVLSGAKEFCLVAPTDVNLQAYQEWLCSKHQDADFLPDNLPNQDQVYKICLKAHQTLIIPSGWIHAVYTPVDSLVLGGNFLHGLAIQRQLQAYDIEQKCRVPDETLFPYYRQLHVCAVGYYYAQILMSKPAQAGLMPVQQEMEGLPALLQQVETWVYQDDGKLSSEQPTVQKLAQELAQKHGLSTFGALLDDFRRRLQTDASLVSHKEGTRSSLPEKQATASRIPRIRLRTKSQTVDTTIAAPAAPTTNVEEEPLIQLSEPQRALPIPGKLVATRKREDVASFVDQDDEWTPSSRKSPKRSSKRPKTLPAESAKNKTSSRNRLLKKLK